MKIYARTAFMCLGAVSLTFGIAPLAFGIFNTGIVVLILYGAAVFGVAFLWNRMDGHGHITRNLHEVSDKRRVYTPIWWQRTRRITVVILAILTLGAVTLSVFMVRAAYLILPEKDAVVIVLGCRVLDDQPSVMLKNRLDVALKFLNENPQTFVICAGGQGVGETYTEAYVMEKYLLAAGIAQPRILREERSTNTLENLEFSADIMREHNLATNNAAIATDAFHQLRARWYARRVGINVGALSSTTPWGLAPSYWVREWFGLVKAWVLDL